LREFRGIGGERKLREHVILRKGWDDESFTLLDGLL
jgi:hypothetical protein